jgi:hypothetical protein
LNEVSSEKVFFCIPQVLRAEGEVYKAREAAVLHYSQWSILQNDVKCPHNDDFLKEAESFLYSFLKYLNSLKHFGIGVLKSKQKAA